MYNPNQEAFIVVIIDYKLLVFLLCLLCKIFFQKYRLYKSYNIIFILPTDRPSNESTEAVTGGAL